MGRTAGEGTVWILIVLACLLAIHPVAFAQSRERRDDVVAHAGGTYRRPVRSDPVTLDPAKIRDVYGVSVSQQIFDGLVQFDHTLTIAPALAQFWKATRDGLAWTFTLRKDVRFHDGRPVTADDVVYSLTRLLDPKVQSGGVDLFTTIKGAQEFREGRATRVSGLRAIDRSTVEVTLNESLAPFASLLAVGYAKIVPREVVEHDPDGFGRHPVGTGPFKLVRWDRGKEIVLAANPEYFQGPPHLSRVVYRIYAGAQYDGVYDDFKRGELEDAPVTARDYARVMKDPGHQFVRRPTFSVRFYAFNTRLPAVQDRRVRLAIRAAIDRQTIVEDFFLGRHPLAKGILPPGTLGYNAKLVAPPYDPAIARELLAQAGHPGGKGLPPLDIWSSVNEATVLREHEAIKKWLAAVGIRAEFHYLTDWPAFSRGVAEGRYPMFLYAWNADVPDPDNFLFKLFHSQSPRNFFGYRNPVVDELLTHARLEHDLARRVDLYRRVEQLVLDDVPVIPVWHLAYERVFQPYVRSIEVNGLGDPYMPLRKMWLDLPR